jgi:hypothetical protein
VIPARGVELVPNVGVIVGDRAALAVDSGPGPRNGAIVRSIAETLAGDRPLFLTLTHWPSSTTTGSRTPTSATVSHARSPSRDRMATATNVNVRVTIHYHMKRTSKASFASKIGSLVDNVCDIRSRATEAQASDANSHAPGGSPPRPRPRAPSSTCSESSSVYPPEEGYGSMAPAKESVWRSWLCASSLSRVSSAAVLAILVDRATTFRPMVRVG